MFGKLVGEQDRTRVPYIIISIAMASATEPAAMLPVTSARVP
jgi:hypothetical protein